MNDDLKAEIEKVVARRGPSDCFCESGLVIPRLLAALELAIEQRDACAHRNHALDSGKRERELDEDNAAILFNLRGEA